jgi:hypothetical protein
MPRLRGALSLGDRVTAVPEPAGLGGSTARATHTCWTGATTTPRARFSTCSLRGVRAEASLQPFTARTSGGDHGFPAGSVSIPLQIQNMDADELHALVLDAESHTGVPFAATNTGYSVEGIDLGSGNVRPVTPPRPLMIVGSGVSANEAGQIWHLLDTRVDLPITKVDRDNVKPHQFRRLHACGARFGQLQLPGRGQARRVAELAAGRGTLVAIRSAANWAVGQGYAPRLEARIVTEAGDLLPGRLGRRTARAPGLGRRGGDLGLPADRGLHLPGRRRHDAPDRFRTDRPQHLRLA